SSPEANYGIPGRGNVEVVPSIARANSSDDCSAPSAKVPDSSAIAACQHRFVTASVVIGHMAQPGSQVYLNDMLLVAPATSDISAEKSDDRVTDDSLTGLRVQDERRINPRKSFRKKRKASYTSFSRQRINHKKTSNDRKLRKKLHRERRKLL